MEYKFHRWKFPNWVPSPTMAIAADPFSHKVAIGRKDGDIEIFCANAKWYSLATVQGQVDFNLQKLVWSTMQEYRGRLFGISLKGFIFEVDLAKLSIVNISDSYGGSAFCLAVSYRTAILAVGCEDGTARIFSYDGHSTLQYVRSIPSTNSRVLSCAFHPSLPQLFLGCADGTIRCVDENNGRSLFRMTGDTVRGTTTHIWSLLVLKDSTIISGDNRGHLQFWNGKVGVLTNTIEQHTGEIYCIVASPEEDAIFASGTDSRVIVVNKVLVSTDRDKDITDPEQTTDRGGEASWVYSTAQRAHSHDVMTLAICTATGGEPVLLSGGMDCKLCLYPILRFGQTRPSWRLPLPAKGGLSVRVGGNPMNGYTMVRHRTHIDIWELHQLTAPVSKSARIGSGEGEKEKEETPLASQTCTLRLRLESSTSGHFICAIMSSVNAAGGNTFPAILVASSASGTKLWHLSELPDKSIKVMKLQVPKLASDACGAMAVSDDARLLALSLLSGNIVLLDVHTNGSAEDLTVSVNVRHVFGHRTMVESAGHTAGDRVLGGAVSRMVLSSDGQWLAAADAAEYGRVFIYDLDRLRLHWTIPRCTGPVSAISFQRSTPSTLAVVQANNYFLLHNVITCQLHPWSANESNILPSVLLDEQSPLRGLSFSPDRSNVLVLYAHGYFVYVDLSLPIPALPTVIAATSSVPNKNKWNPSNRNNSDKVSTSSTADEALSNDSNFKKVHRFRGLLELCCLEGDQMVMIENPWVAIVAQLPDMLARKRFRT